MTRYLLLLSAVGLAPAAASAVPPVPRVVLPPEAHKPAEDPPGEPESPDDPAKVAERIAKNAKALGEKLAGEDTGPDTLTGQEKLKKDIDSLIKALENPPPMSNQSNPMENQQGNQGQPPPPQGGEQPMGGGQPKPMGGQRPMGNQSGRQPGGQKPMGGGQPMPQPGGQGQPMPQPGGQQPMGGQPDAKPQPGQQGGKPMPAGSQPGGGGMAKPALPLDEAIARDFWGNLPDLPRQRMLQFFREQYMSRYKELLPQYYQSLAEKEKKGKK
jgi:hypothetical protein